MTTKEKLEQLGWKVSPINNKELYKMVDDTELSLCIKSFEGTGIGFENKTPLRCYTFMDLTELQLILDYIKEQE